MSVGRASAARGAHCTERPRTLPSISSFKISLSPRTWGFLFHLSCELPHAPVHSWEPCPVARLHGLHNGLPMAPSRQQVALILLAHRTTIMGHPTFLPQTMMATTRYLQLRYKRWSVGVDTPRFALLLPANSRRPPPF